MESNKFSITKRFESFKYAFNGLVILLKEEHNSRIHLLGAIVAITLGFLLDISIIEWFVIIFSIGFVISLEFINSAIESLADYVCPERHHLIKKTKDLAAGGVLWSVLTSIVLGAIIFIPKIWELIV